MNRVVGWFLLLAPFVPLTLLFGDIDRSRGLVAPGEALLGIFVFGVVSVLGARFFPASAPERSIQTLERETGRGRYVAGIAVLALAVLLLATATLAFARRPMLVDSVIQLFQARIFASGHLYAPVPPDEAFFAVQHMLVDGGKWYSQYPPGHPALMAVGVRLGAAWLVPIALSLGTALFLYGFTRRAYDLATARATVVLLVCAPFFWFMGASRMNHVSALFFVSVFLYLLARWEDGGGWRSLLGAGLAIGGAFLSRPLTAAAVGVALTPAVLATARRRRDTLSVVAGAAGALFAVLLYLGYNTATTGDPLLPGYVKLWGENHGLGFHATPWGGMHTPLAGLRNELTDVSLLSSMLLEWPIPALLPAGLLLAAGWGDRKWDGRLVAGFVALPVAYFFYWHRDAFLGPRYLYSGVAFVVPLTARGLLQLFRWAKGRVLWKGSALTRVPVASAAGLLVLLCFLYAAAYSAPRRFHVYRTGLASMKIDLPATARAAGVSDALVFIPVSWGNRLLARMRALGVGAAQAETAYRTVDHCDLELVLDRAESEGWDGELTAGAVAALPPVGDRVPSSSPMNNDDPTLRLRRGRVPAAVCLDELAYDRAGYLNYSPFLAEQEPSLRGSLVIARDLRDRDVRLMDRYPGRAAFLFRGGRFLPMIRSGD